MNFYKILTYFYGQTRIESIPVPVDQSADTFLGRFKKILALKSYFGFIKHVQLWITSERPLCYANGECAPDTDKVHVILIHGTADKSNAFVDMVTRWFAQSLPEEIGSINLVKFKIRKFTASIEEFNEEVIKLIIENAEKFGHQKIILVGHSRGGLIATECALFFENHPEYGIEILGTFPLAAPFKGSYLAIKPLRWNKSIDQMHCGSEYLRKLQERIKASKLYFYCFGAKKDGIVLRNSAAIPDKPFEVIPDHGHVSMLHSHTLIDRLNVLFSELINRQKVDEDAGPSHRNDIDEEDEKEMAEFFLMNPEQKPTELNNPEELEQFIANGLSSPLEEIFSSDKGKESVEIITDLDMAEFESEENQCAKPSRS